MATRREVSWALGARQDLKDIVDYIAVTNPLAAQEWLADVLERAGKLNQYPEMGRAIPETANVRYRELMMGDYRIFYEVTIREIRIFGILHSRRLFLS